jgi:pimeloyl-ACP methyl ester carboxylesterase
VVLPHDEAGSGPSVLLLHAGIADRTMWREQIEALAGAGYRALALDLPGFGAAPPADGPPAPWTDVLETMEALGVESAGLVGNSYGGAVALRVALLSPERVWALVLVSAPAPELQPSPQLQAAWDAESAALDRGDVEAAVQVVLAAWLLPGAPAALRERVAAMARLAFRVALAAGEQTEAPDPLEQDPRALQRITAPALLLAGVHDMPDFRDGATQLAAALVGARQALIDEAGHLAPLEAPQAFTGLLLDFLAAHAPHDG